MKKIFPFNFLAFSFAMTIFHSHCAWSQEISEQFPKTNIVSPTASALGQYADFPVNMHSGVPEISIPIYTVQEGPLQLPISLSYHASGLRVMDVASWVGAGWSLNAGGVVSRTVMGLPDEKQKYASLSFYKDKGYSNYYLSDTGVDPYSTADYERFFTGQKDGEPDLFTFNFGNYSGKFFFREDQTVVVFPETDLKINAIIDENSEYEYLRGFRIIDPAGVRYWFGITTLEGDVDPIERSQIALPGERRYPSSISSWYLYKIESPDTKFAINISYRKEKYGYLTISASPYLEPTSNNVTPVKVFIEGVTPSEILVTNGSVKFIADTLRLDVSTGYGGFSDLPNTEAKRLDKIQIISNPSALTPTNSKSFHFSYDYFVSHTARPLPWPISQWNTDRITDQKRLKLLSVQEKSSDNTLSNPPFSFHYYDEQNLPWRLSFGQDHWGFYNGIETNTTYAPKVSADNGASYSPGDDKESRWPAMRAGALKMIQYPTGGGTEYVYEPNKAMTTNNCSFTQSGNALFNLSAGMGTSAAEVSSPHQLVVETPTAYYVSLNANGSGASGSLLVDNVAVATVSPSNLTFSNFIFLPAGSYKVAAAASADNGSGVGVLATFYEAVANCDNAKERIVGGLRIQQIVKFGTVESPKLSMSYTYESPNLYSIPTYIFKIKHDLIKTGMYTGSTEIGCKETTPGSGAMQTYSSPISVHPMHTVQGSHIGYKNVKEIAADGGYSIYKYYGMPMLPSNWYTLEDVSVRKVDATVCTLTDPIYPSVPLPFDFQRGNLISRQVFDKNNNKIRETNYTMSYRENPVGIFGLKSALNPLTNSPTSLPSHYELKSAKLNWTKEIERTFNSDGTSIDLETNTYFESEYHRMPTRVTRTSQTGLIETKYVNVLDMTKCRFKCPICDTNFLAKVAILKQVFSSKDQNCKVGICVGSSEFGSEYVEFKGVESISSPCTGNNATEKKINCRRAAWLDFQYRLNTARVYHGQSLDFYSESAANCNENNRYSHNNPSIDALYLMELYNQLNIVEATVFQDNIFQSSAFLEYQRDPSSWVYLKNTYSTEANAPGGDFTKASISSTVILKDAKYESSPSSTYLFKDGRPVEVIDRSGTTSFIWGLNNTVPIVKALGVTHTVLQAAYEVAPANLRSQSALTGAQITTYTYEPLIGITSVTDANGRKLEYEYDKLGRLLRIKDPQGKVVEEYNYSYRVN